MFTIIDESVGYTDRVFVAISLRQRMGDMWNPSAWLVWGSLHMPDRGDESEGEAVSVVTLCVVPEVLATVRAVVQAPPARPGGSTCCYSAGGAVGGRCSVGADSS